MSGYETLLGTHLTTFSGTDAEYLRYNDRRRNLCSAHAHFMHHCHALLCIVWIIGPGIESLFILSVSPVDLSFSLSLWVFIPVILTEDTVGTDNMQDPEKQPQPQSKEADSSTPDKPLFPETDLPRGIVGWDGQDDPANSQNFSPAQKWGLLALISSVTLISPLASSMFSPAVGYMAADFGESDQTLVAFSVSIFLLGYTVGFCILRSG